MAILSSTQIAGYARQAGFSGTSVGTITAIALAESGGNTTATNTVGNSAGVDRGLVQINSHFHPEVSDSQAFDPLQSMIAAYRISGGGRAFSPWSTYTNGAYRRFIGNVPLGNNTPTGPAPSPPVQQPGGRAWFSYPVTQAFGQGPEPMGGEHGVDLGVPLDTKINNIIGAGTITDVGTYPWGQALTWKLDTPIHNAPYGYQIHFDAVDPSFKVGTHINMGQFLGYSGGEISLAGAPGLPAGYTHHLNNPANSTGPHTELGLTLGPREGYGAGYVNLAGHPELNPAFLVNAAVTNGAPFTASGGPGTPAPAGSPGPIPGFIPGSDALNAIATGITSIAGTANSFSTDLIRSLTTTGAEAPDIEPIAQQVHDTLVSVPGFYGICLAIDEAETFPGIVNYTAGPLDVGGMARTVIATVMDNSLALAIRSLLVFLGMLLLAGLVWNLVQSSGVLQAAGSLSELAA